MQYVAYNKNTLYHAMFKMHAKKNTILKKKNCSRLISILELSANKIQAKTKEKESLSERESSGIA